MQPPEVGLWKHVPGNIENDEDGAEDEEENELKVRAKKCLSQVATVLGDRWLDVPCIDFSPVEPSSSSTALPQSRMPPSQWGSQGPPLSFRMEHVRAPVVKDTFTGNNLKQTSGRDWLVMWSGPRMRDKEYQALHELQRVNHFPGSTELTRKDRICVHFDRMAQRFGTKAFNFVPKTYVLPRQVDEFLNEFQNTKKTWICKPPASSQGKGIFLLRDLKELPTSEDDKNSTVISHYVDNPLLIQGLKFDLRVYVLVTSFEPLRVYIYREGLTRFASKPYSTEDKHLGDVYRHLTNYSINKKAANFLENQEVKADNVGHKWSFSALSRHLKHVGVDADRMWTNIMDLVLKTLICVRPVIASETRRATVHSNNCFELYGFDVLVDENLKPWLLEVNLSPSMMADSPLDWQVKSSVLSDAFNLVGIPHASWKSLATSKLRSQLLQMKHAADAQAKAAAGMLKAAVDAQAARDSPISPEDCSKKLHEFNERDLKSLAQAFREVGKLSNFIRLYPTPESVQKYAPLMPRSSPVGKLMLQLMYGEDILIPKCSLDDDIPEDISAPATMKQEGLGDDNVFPAFDSLKGDDIDGEEESADHEPVGLLDWTGINAAVQYDSARVIAAKHILKPLNVKASSRVLLIEYVVRLTNTCRALHLAGRKKLAQSKAYKRLVTFKQQVSIFLRTTARTDRDSYQPEVEDIDDDVIDALISCSRLCIARVAKHLWAAAAAAGAPPQSPRGSHSLLAMPDQLPPAFAKSTRGERIIEAVLGLSSSELESILRSPDCIPEIVSLFGGASQDLDEDEDEDDFEVIEKNELIGNSGEACGPLSEILIALGPVPAESPKKADNVGSVTTLPSIFAGMPLVSHAAAACRSQAPLLKDLSKGRSSSTLKRYGQPSEANSAMSTRAKSLPALHPAVSAPHRPSYLPPSLPVIPSVRARQMQKTPYSSPLRPAVDYSQADTMPSWKAKPPQKSLRSVFDMMQHDIEF